MGQSAITLESHLCGKGVSFDEIFSATTTELTTTTAAYFRASINSEFAWDDIRLIAGTRGTVETFTHNDANEQLTHTKNGVTTDMEYDAWGHLTKRDDGTHEATYGYRYGSKLYSVASDFPGEGNVIYETGGDGDRRSRDDGSTYTWFNYAFGRVMHEESDGSGPGEGSLTRSFFGDFAEAPGSTPASDPIVYYARDHLGSTRGAFDASRNRLGKLEFTSFGEEFFDALDSSLRKQFTVHQQDETAGFYFTRFRYLSPALGRWISRDPLAMVDGPNVYAYVGNNPVRHIDLFGLDRVGCDGVPNKCENKRPCVQEACAAHDKCYRENNCGSGSWLPFGHRACNKCNRDVVRAIAKCLLKSPGDSEECNKYCSYHKKCVDSDPGAHAECVWYRERED